MANGFTYMLRIDFELIGFKPPHRAANKPQDENHPFVGIHPLCGRKHGLLSFYAYRA
ncbi:Uncharacterised protein [Vibrio cholerae]|nr:Uncharacterised protein [Vibrio cholerae]CSC54974.1 Uncharacterised protein [Vibrio cholerae]